MKIVNDKRILKTKTSIKNAYMYLMLDKQFNKINVSDIAKQAQINRSTFYLHYNCVGDVMTDIENEIFNRVLQCVECFDIYNIYNSIYVIFNNLTTTLDELQVVKNYILYSTNSLYTINRIKEIFNQIIYNAFCKAYNTEGGNLPYYTSYLSAGVVDTYIKWALEKNEKITLDELSKTVSQTSELLIVNIKV